MSPQHNVSNPSGFPEWTPAQQQVQERWLAVIRAVFGSFGFLPIETPLVEREENLVAKGGNAKEMYVLKRLLEEDSPSPNPSLREGDSKKRDALRFDHTVPLALYVARHLQDIAFPFKRSAIGPVLRGERAQKGRFRQFIQCDIDVIGQESLSLAYDAEVVAVIIEIFQKLNLGDFVVRINNRKVLLGFFRSLGVAEADLKAVLDIIDDLEKIGEAKVLEALQKTGLAADDAQQIIDFTQITGTPIDMLQQLSDMSKDESFQTGVAELRQVFAALRSMQVNANAYKLDLAIARGLDYYTGTVFETNLVGYQGLGSICSGGRYEDLAEIFTGKKYPGVGISIGLTRLLSQLFDADLMQTDRSSPTEVLILPMGSEQQAYALEIATQLRSSGKNVEVYLEPKKMKRQFAYADKLGVPYCAIIGEDEMNKKSVQWKDMKTGEQRDVPQSDLISLL